MLPLLLPLLQPLFELFSPNSSGNTVRIPLVKVCKPGYADLVYIANGTVGTPGQNLTFLFNPTTQYSWIPSDPCDVGDSICERHGMYNAMLSSSFWDLRRYLTVPYPMREDGHELQAIGDLIQEAVCVGTTCTSKFPMVLSEWNSVVLFAYSLQDGVIGLGYRDNATEPVTFLDVLRSEGQINSMIATFHLERNPKNSSLGKGELILGAIDKSMFSSPIAYVPLARERQWEIIVDKATIGGKDLAFSENLTAAFDTNYAYIGGPYATIVEIYHAIDAHPYDGGRYNVSCDRVATLPTVTFYVGGHKLSLEAEDYILRKPYVSYTSDARNYNETVCEVAFNGLQYSRKYSRNWAFGTIFFEKFSTIFDMENHRVGFADPKKRYYS